MDKHQEKEEKPINIALQKYLPIIDFLAEVLGNDTEVVLQEVSETNNSIVAIRNSISGRKIGAPATNLALKIIKSEKYGDKNYITNYKGILENGKILKSSTYFIRDEKQQLIGMICINIDIDKFTQFRNYLDSIIRFPEEDDSDKTVERFRSSVEEITFDSIEAVVKRSGISPERMSQDEKIDVIKELNNEGVFFLKGAVSEAASKLKVSEATIYRYLNKIKKESAGSGSRSEVG